MRHSQKWGRSRYVALFVVFALHVGLLAVLFILPRTRFLANSAAIPVELLILPPQHTATKPPSSAASSRDGRLEIRTPTPTSSTAITLSPHTDGDNSGVGVDWEQEARNVAKAMADSGSAKNERPAETISPFTSPPPHHPGEQFAAADGHWIVYISDRCYQVSSAIGDVSNASHNGMGLQTYCTRRPNTPRGDLFNQLPAYKAHHPEN